MSSDFKNKCFGGFLATTLTIIIIINYEEDDLKNLHLVNDFRKQAEKSYKSQ